MLGPKVGTLVASEWGGIHPNFGWLPRAPIQKGLFKEGKKEEHCPGQAAFVLFFTPQVSQWHLSCISPKLAFFCEKGKEAVLPQTLLLHLVKLFEIY